MTIDGRDESFRCGEDMNVLAAMERARCRGIPVGCRNGGCGACKVRILSGSYHTGKMNRAVVSAEEQAQGCALACKLFPREDLGVRALGRVWQHARPPQSTSFSFAFSAAIVTPLTDKET
ncbi:MAG TPA: 2Fe-2S iron-sulfur cluster binding domain-containing protein [Rubrivivax sp.]|nr:2Fe-2S iron-sulfur cluster binding domain-containing protein [Rubrivivax sp.]